MGCGEADAGGRRRLRGEKGMWRTGGEEEGSREVRVRRGGQGHG